MFSEKYLRAMALGRISFAVAITIAVIVITTLLYSIAKRFFGNRKPQQEIPSDLGEIQQANSNSVRKRSQIVPQGNPLLKGSEKKFPCKIVPRSVNYHFTRQCNYKCGFCFHTAKTSFVLPIEEAKQGLKMLKEAGEP